MYVHVTSSESDKLPVPYIPTLLALLSSALFKTSMMYPPLFYLQYSSGTTNDAICLNAIVSSICIIVCRWISPSAVGCSIYITGTLHKQKVQPQESRQ